mgnify:CR=1 FL=1
MAQNADSQQWIDGFREAYAGLAPRVVADDDRAYPAGRHDGEALRLRHEQILKTALVARQIAGREGFQAGYEGRRASDVEATYQEAYSEGERLREEHEHEVEQALFNSRRVRPGPTA